MTYFSDVFDTGLEQVRRSWGWFLVFGILLMMLGVVVCRQGADRNQFLDPGVGLGPCRSAECFGSSIRSYAFNWHGFFLFLLNALIRGAAGYLLIRHPDAGAEGVTMLLAILFIVGGLFRAIGSSVIQFPRWGWTMFAGLVSVALGIYLLMIWPTASTFFFGLAIGIDLIFDGAALIGFAGAIHSLPSDGRAQPELPDDGRESERSYSEVEPTFARCKTRERCEP